MSTTYDNFVVIGDLNYDMLSPQKCTSLKHVCDIFDFTNMIKSPTCLTKNAPPTLNDVILTNQSNYCQNALNFNYGLSDVHNTISIQIKGNLPKLNRDFINYRSFKHLDQNKFLSDLHDKNVSAMIDKTSDVNAAYDNFENFFLEVIDITIYL